MSLLSLIAASMMSTGTLTALMERNALRRAQVDALAESAITLGILGLLDTRPEGRWRVDGVAQETTLEGTRVKISIRDEFGLIDLNQAGVELFRGLFRSAELSEKEASELADRVIEWRTSGNARARAADYRDADLSYAPRRAPFQSVDELRLVLGMTPEIFVRIEPALTVYSQQPSVDQRAAPREALLALPGMDARRVDTILRDRASALRNSSAGGPPIGQGVADTSLVGHPFTVTVEFAYRGTAVKRTAVIRVGGNGGQPYLTLAAD